MADSLLSGHLLWLESGWLVLGANMKHVENKTWSTVWTSPLAGVWVFGAGCQHEACGEQNAESSDDSKLGLLGCSEVTVCLFHPGNIAYKLEITSRTYPPFAKKVI